MPAQVFESSTVRFPHRSRRGVLLGLSVPQLVVAGAAALLLLIALMGSGLLGAAKLIPLWMAAAVLVAVRFQGRSLAEWAPIAARYTLRRATGQQAWLAQVGTRPRKAGLLHLPGTAASLTLVTAPDRRLSAVHDPHHRTLTAVCRVTTRAFALLDPAVQDAHVAGWGRVLAALSRTGHLTRIQVLERTVPSSGDALQRHWRGRGNPANQEASRIYTELVEAAGPAAAAHETYVVLALDLTAARRLIRQAGGGLTGAFTLLTQIASTFDQSARTAGLTPAGWLTGPQLAAVIRTAYDPAALPALEHWAPDGPAQADPAAAGPVLVVEEADHLRTDSAFHTVYWIENWPRTEVSPGFLHQLLFTAGIRRTLSLTYTPHRIDAALKDVRRRKATVVADAHERTRRGQVDSEEDGIEYADITSRERQLIAGHADISLTGLLTVTADSRRQLEAACASIETAAVTAQVDLRRLTWQQTEAFTTGALPLARP
ncbi:hypothetical protein BIV57_19165 [Mangrovactinospora gilvigrisea]|uniref:Type VII secretion system protein EccE domain-containing protein n=1 Tax=Mangrovactinospora gilvigrisea TaxID=1428644 RepID=A0A1J7C873_9ACTN|nr:SCO6880 family protein [Mangrovactinospora gilvigrisea]OIV35842.1 hypothetical protein BIV57_19165 [Mangrovactinospora gilvigrisea]